MKNAVLDAAWQAVHTQVVDHCLRIFAETGSVETVINMEVREIDSRTGHIAATLSDGAMVSADFSLWEAAREQGFDMSAVNCFGTAARPN